MIKEIILDINGGELHLSIEDAKKLRKALNALFGESIPQYIPQYIPYPTKPYQPWTPYWMRSTTDNNLVKLSATLDSTNFKR